MSSRSHRHLTDYSQGSSSRHPRYISVSEAVENLRLTETCGGASPRSPTSYPSDRRQHRTSFRDSGYSESPLDVGIYSRTASPHSYLQPSPTFDPAVLSTHGHSSYTSSPYSLPPITSPASGSVPRSGGMSYQSYTGYHPSSSRTSSYPGFPDPSTSAPISYPVSGPTVRSILPSSLNQEFEEAGREAGRRRRALHRPRREKKRDLRRMVLPNNVAALSSQTEDVSGSIDSFIAQSQSPGSYGGGSPYPSRSSAHSPFDTATTRATAYDPIYSGGYTAGGQASYNSYASPRDVDLYADRTVIHRSSRRAHNTAEAAEPEFKCWDHGCKGRQFSTFSNLLRHQREKSGSSLKVYCPRCGADFTRKTARDAHIAHNKCRPRSPRR